MMDYVEKLVNAVKDAGSLLCVGLDPDPEQIPAKLHDKYPDPVELVEVFCREVIDATQDHCCAYKPNLAFFEALGGEGLKLFERVLGMVPTKKIVIADAKRGDIGYTAEQYKIAYFDQFNVDAVTLNPLMGFDTLDPFIHDRTKAIYILVLTSNPGSFDMLKRRFEGQASLAEYIAEHLRHKSEIASTHIGMVVGATHPSSLKEILSAHPAASLLIPGIGSQGGDLNELLPVLDGHRGIPLVTSSRSILYEKDPGKNWKSGVSRRAEKMKEGLKPLTNSYE